jgi:hypothetical protein
MFSTVIVNGSCEYASAMNAKFLPAGRDDRCSRESRQARHTHARAQTHRGKRSWHRLHRASTGRWN